MVVLVPYQCSMRVLHLIPTQPTTIFHTFIIVLPSVGLDIISSIANCSVRFLAVTLPVEPNPKGFKMLASLAAPFKRAFNHDPEKANTLSANGPASAPAAMPTRVCPIGRSISLLSRFIKPLNSSDLELSDSGLLSPNRLFCNLPLEAIKSKALTALLDLTSHFDKNSNKNLYLFELTWKSPHFL